MLCRSSLFGMACALFCSFFRYIKRAGNLTRALTCGHTKAPPPRGDLPHLLCCGACLLLLTREEFSRLFPQYACTHGTKRRFSLTGTKARETQRCKKRLARVEIRTHELDWCTSEVSRIPPRRSICKTKNRDRVVGVARDLNSRP